MMHAHLRFCLAQINPTVGDMQGNAEKIISYIEQARRMSADVIVFPELSLCGYPPEDLLFRSSFIKQNQIGIKKISAASSSIFTIVGFPYLEQGKLYNAAGLIWNGRLQHVYKKTHLPNYGVFDEKRYFNTGNEFPVVEVNRHIRIGITICQDIWEDKGPHIYQAGWGKARIIINISASPYHVQKIYQRHKLLQNLARKTRAYFLYCNIVGGQDELVFDGGSFAVDPYGSIIVRGKQFAEDSVLVDIPIMKDTLKYIPRSHQKTNRKYMRVLHWDHVSSIPRVTLSQHIEPMLNPREEVYQALVFGLRDYVIKNNFKKVVLGLSGGIDSSLTAVIAVDALGKDNVIGLSMPSEYSSRGTRKDARRLAEHLGITFKTISIQPIVRAYKQSLQRHFQGLKPDITEENLQARIRGNLLMAFSNKYGWLVITTGNKSEVSVGYCTLYGDTAGGLSVLKDVPKMQVYTLAAYRNDKSGIPIIPISVIRRPPTAELRPRQKDQDSLPRYEVLDKVLEEYILKRKDASAIHVSQLNRKQINEIVTLVDKNEYKRRQSPPGIKITPLAFGKDRRMPITFKKS